MRVLFVSFLFPPHGGGGVQRTVKFIKYLARADFEITVLTGTANNSLADPALFRDLPESIDIQRVKGLFLPSAMPWTVKSLATKWFLVIDSEVGWLPFAALKGMQILDRKNNFDIIYSTSSPYTDHLVAMHLKKHQGLPWVADFRDPWIANVSLKFATPIHKMLCTYLEKRIVHSADRILVVSEPMKKQFLTRYPEANEGRFITIPNGFDHEDYLNRASYKGESNTFKLVYTGSIYGSRRTARPVLEALSKAFQKNLIDRTRFSLVFVGAVGNKTRRLVDDFNLNDVVRIDSYRQHDEVIDAQLEADALLLIIGPGPGSEIVFTGKIFEYLAAHRPIIAVVPEGPAAKLIRETHAGSVLPPEDTDAIAQALANHFKIWKEGNLKITPNTQHVDNYRRSVQAKKLAGVFQELVQN